MHIWLYQWLIALDCGGLGEGGGWSLLWQLGEQLLEDLCRISWLRNQYNICLLCPFLALCFFNVCLRVLTHFSWFSPCLVQVAIQWTCCLLDREWRAVLSTSRFLTSPRSGWTTSTMEMLVNRLDSQVCWCRIKLFFRRVSVFSIWINSLWVLPVCSLGSYRRRIVHIHT